MNPFDAVVKARSSGVCHKSSVVRASSSSFAEVMYMVAGSVLTTHIVGSLGLPLLMMVSLENEKEKRKKKD